LTSLSFGSNQSIFIDQIFRGYIADQFLTNTERDSIGTPKLKNDAVSSTPLEMLRFPHVRYWHKAENGNSAHRCPLTGVKRTLQISEFAIATQRPHAGEKRNQIKARERSIEFIDEEGGVREFGSGIGKSRQV
jgi:hypothetical protein